jgi:predicted peptidase
MYAAGLEDMMRIIRCLVLALIIAAPVLSDTGFLNRSITVAGRSYRYQVYVPADYTPARKWPVIVYLHGNGGQGDDGVFPTAADLGNTIRRYRSPFPAIVLFPQAPKQQYWEQLLMQELVMAELDQVDKELTIEHSRQYLTGHSMGAAGAYRIAYRWPDRFAALVTVSGTVQPIPPHLGPDRAEIDRNTNPFTAGPDAF